MYRDFCQFISNKLQMKWYNFNVQQMGGLGGFQTEPDCNVVALVRPELTIDHLRT